MMLSKKGISFSREPYSGSMLNFRGVHPDTFDHFDLHGMKHLARCSQAWECSGVLLQSRSGAFRDLISWLQKTFHEKKMDLVSNSKNENSAILRHFFRVLDLVSVCFCCCPLQSYRGNRSGPPRTAPCRSVLGPVAGCRPAGGCQGAAGPATLPGSAAGVMGKMMGDGHNQGCWWMMETQICF